MILWSSVILLIAAVPFVLYRTLKGPEWTDRILGLDLLSFLLAAGLLLLKRQFQITWISSALWILFLGSVFGYLAATLAFERENNRE